MDSDTPSTLPMVLCYQTLSQYPKHAHPTFEGMENSLEVLLFFPSIQSIHYAEIKKKRQETQVLMIDHFALLNLRF
jgi:hypothetical protein